MLFTSKYNGLKIVFKPGRKYHDDKGRPVKEKGIYAKFEEGVFKTEDKELIELLKDYMKQYPGDIVMIDEAKEKKKSEAIKKVIDEIEAEAIEEKIRKIEEGDIKLEENPPEQKKPVKKELNGAFGKNK